MNMSVLWNFIVSSVLFNLCSLLVLSRSSSTSTQFSVSTVSLGASVLVWLSVRSNLTWSQTEVLLGFSILVTSEENASLTVWWDLCQLIERQNLTTVFNDSLSGGFSNSQGSNLQTLWSIQQTSIIGNCTNNNSDGFLLFSNELAQSGKSDWSLILSCVQQSSQNLLVEFRTGSSGQELVELNQDGHVYVWWNQSLSGGLLFTALLQPLLVDTLLNVSKNVFQNDVPFYGDKLWLIFFKRIFSIFKI